KVDMSTEILGVKYASPIVLAPVGGQRSFHDEGEVASARAAKVGNHLQILSTGTSLGVEDVTSARGQPIWYQLYATGGDGSHGEARGEGRRSRGGGDCRRRQWPQPGDSVPPAPHRHARLQQLP